MHRHQVVSYVAHHWSAAGGAESGAGGVQGEAGGGDTRPSLAAAGEQSTGPSHAANVILRYVLIIISSKVGEVSA